MNERDFGAQSVALSVLICTLDRADSLQVTLQRLVENDFDMSRVEILVVDNSEGGTVAEIVESFAGRLNTRFLHEPRRGKYHALNKGLDVARAPVIAVLDDDMSPGPDYCEEVLAVCERWPTAGVFASSSYVVPPAGYVVPEWVVSRGVVGWAMSVIEYHREGIAEPGHYLSGNHFWFRREAVGSRRFPEFWAPEAHFTLGLVDDGATAVVSPRPRVGHRVQPQLLTLDAQRKRAALAGAHLPRFRLDFPDTVPGAALAAKHPVVWKLRCAANLARWLVVFAATPLLRQPQRTVRELVARVAIANNIACLRHRRCR